MWTDQLAPFNSPPPRPPGRPGGKSPRPFVLLLSGSVLAGFVAFILMQLAFGAADNGAALLFEIVGFALFIVWLASIVGFIVGLVGIIVRLAQR